MTEENLDTTVFKKKLPLENAEFSKKYWAKHNVVYRTTCKSIQRAEPVYFFIYQDEILQNRSRLFSINFKRGDIFIELENKEIVKIPMNMEMVESYIDYDHIKFSAIFYGKNQWQVSDDSDVPDCKYLITNFIDDEENPLLNDNAPRDDIRITKIEEVTVESDGLSTSLSIDFDETWANFFALIKEKIEEEETIYVTFFHNTEDDVPDLSDTIILAGKLTEISVDENTFLIGVDNETFYIEEAIDDLEIYIPEDNSTTLGYFPCTININNQSIDTLIHFCVLDDELMEEDTDDENQQNWDLLYENIAIMFELQTPVFFTIIDNDSKNIMLKDEIMGIRFDKNIVFFSFESEKSFNFDMDKTIISLDCNSQTKIFNAVFKSNFIIKENNTEQEFLVFISNQNM